MAAILLYLRFIPAHNLGEISQLETKMPAKFYRWQKTNEDSCSDQMLTVGQNTARAPYKALLNISDEDSTYWIACATLYKALQKDALPDFDAFKQALTGERDFLTHGPGQEPFVAPTLPAYDLPTPPAGVEIRRGFFAWANVLVKQWKAIPAFDEDMQRQMGLVVPVESETVATPEVRSMKAHSGGLVEVEVYLRGAAMAIVQLNVDGAGWPDVKIGGRYQKTLSGSGFEFQLEAGVAHSVQVRTAFADRAGNMTSDWSAVETLSSLA